LRKDPAIISILSEEKDQANDIQIISFSPSKEIEELGKELGIAVQECPVHLSQYWGIKAGSKDAFLKSGIPTPRGTTDVWKSLDDIQKAVVQLVQASPPAQRVIVKLNDGSWSNGLGNAVINCEKLLQTNDLSQSIERLFQPWPILVSEISQGGAIVEEYVAESTCSPSAQGYINDYGQVEVLSSHSQILVKDKYLGCIFPAPQQYLPKIYEAVEKVGKTLHSNGVRGTFGIDFIAVNNGDLLATEINVRKLGSSHVFAYVKSLVGNDIAPDGLLINRNGLPIRFVHRRFYEPSLLKYLEPSTAVETLRNKGLLYDQATQTGTILHILGALKSYGYVEITSIETSLDKAFELDRCVQETLLEKVDSLMRASD